MKTLLLFALFSTYLISCSHSPCKNSSPSLQEIVQGKHRTPEFKKRDLFRHPVETLKFFDVQPHMTVVEISPGAGWYTEILAPYLSKGHLYLAAFDSNSSVQYFKKTNKKLTTLVDKLQPLSGKIEYTTFELPKIIGPVAPANSADRVLTFRNVHNWTKQGKAKEAFMEFFRVLKPGGYLGVVEHRENPKAKYDPKGSNGYVHEKEVLKLAKMAGFRLVAKSEINANPKDTKDHPNGVWTLPPVLRSKDKAKYSKIGESDRMTLKFQKPN